MKIILSIDGQEQTVDLSAEMVRSIQATAERNGISFGEALGQTIAAGNFLEAVEATGGKVLVQQDNELREVVKEKQPV